jgi:hypothetical protein
VQLSASNSTSLRFCFLSGSKLLAVATPGFHICPVAYRFVDRAIP